MSWHSALVKIFEALVCNCYYTVTIVPTLKMRYSNKLSNYSSNEQCRFCEITVAKNASRSKFEKDFCHVNNRFHYTLNFLCIIFSLPNTFHPPIDINQVKYSKMSMFKSSLPLEAARNLALEKYNSRCWSEIGELTLERIRMDATYLYCKGL